MEVLTASKGIPHSRPFKISPESKAFIVLLAASVTLPSLSIDSCLASLPVIAGSLGVDAGATVSILSLFLAGFAVGQIAFGPLSDRFGRRPGLVFGCVLFSLASVGCALAPSLAVLAFWRFVQGIGAAAGSVIAFAICVTGSRDLLPGPVFRTSVW
jgi:MFS transporter, DHA1 family, multidrug resistance protein